MQPCELSESVNSPSPHVLHSRSFVGDGSLDTKSPGVHTRHALHDALFGVSVNVPPSQGPHSRSVSMVDMVVSGAWVVMTHTLHDFLQFRFMSGSAALLHASTSAAMVAAQVFSKSSQTSVWSGVVVDAVTYAVCMWQASTLYWLDSISRPWECLCVCVCVCSCACARACVCKLQSRWLQR